MSSANEASRVRVHPWVSYALAALLTIGSLGLFLASPDARETAAENPEMQAAFRYFERNPEVRVNARLLRFLGADYVAEVRERHEKRRAEGGVAVLSQRMQDKTQKRFDEVQRKAFASLHELPSWRHGIVDGDSPVVNTFGHLVVNDSAVAIGVSLVVIALAAVLLEAAWGPLLFGGLCLLLPIVTRLTYTTLYGEQGVPWIGASGLAAGLLGAYLVRSFGGLTVPAWLVLPIWIVAEHVFARDLPIDRFDPAPFVVHAVCFAFGAAAAGAIWVLGLEGRHMERKAESSDLVSNPVLEQALAERDAGNDDEAFDLLSAELGRSPGNYDVAVALWEIASGTSRAQSASRLVLGAVRDGLRKGRVEEACSLWSSIAAEVDPRAEATLTVRVGEALLGQEEHEAALQAFGMALAGTKPLSSVLALRVVRGTRDLDSQLAAKAAAIALIDDQLALADRNAMQTLVDSAALRAGDDPDSTAPLGVPAAAAAPAAAARTPELTPAPAAEPDPFQDPHAIAADAFEKLGEGESLAGEDPEQWNQPGLVEDLSSELEDEEPDSGFDWEGLQDDEDASPSDIPGIGIDTHVDLGPEPAAVAPGAAADVSETTETLGEDEEDFDDLALGDDDGGLSAALAETRRSLRAREAVPVQLDDELLTVEVENGSKTQIPLARIEAVAAGAVRGLADKPVLVIDLALNWLAVPDEPLKVIRMRSDRFDPRALVPGKNSPLDALRVMLDTIVSRSGATPLPSRDRALGNPFASFDDLESYGREVLLVE